MTLKYTALLSLFASFAQAQFGRGGGDWMAVGGDAQRSASVRTDPHISVEAVQGGAMQLLWKIKLNGVPTPPVVASRLITYKGFKDLLYVGTSADNVLSIDHVVGRVFWETHLPYDSLLVPVKTGTATCPAGMTAAVSLAAPLAPPQPPAPRGGRGPGGPPGNAGPGRGGNMNMANVPTLPRPRRTPGTVYALSSDGLIHVLNQHTGQDIVPAARFIRGNAKAHDVIQVGNIVYAVTSDNCGGAPNGVWAIDLADNMVNEWKTGEASVLGLAFLTDGTVIATTTKGIAALEAKTLKVKQQRDGEYATTPTVIKVKDKEYVVASNVHGHVFLLDPVSLELVVNVAGNGATIGSSFASWEEAESKARWILAVKNNAVVSFKIVEKDGTLALEQAWASKEMVAPAPPIVVNGVVFALSSGSRTAPAVLYALDGMTGKELWSSGKAITGYSTSGVSSGASKVFVGTHDGTLYAFGYLLPRE
ncbi:MAG TPA: PQQ-binding-like beta-propeller repeat protein [Bryobacteraceae bacterium]|jgi:outer membrane protein assembly factor BamB|nr:PQQ-binding-like beta-propeller repeat protein [Bryobacteraceae bacterium]